MCAVIRDAQQARRVVLCSDANSGYKRLTGHASHTPASSPLLRPSHMRNQAPKNASGRVKATKCPPPGIITKSFFGARIRATKAR